MGSCTRPTVRWWTLKSPGEDISELTSEWPSLAGYVQCLYHNLSVTGSFSEQGQPKIASPPSQMDCVYDSVWSCQPFTKVKLYTLVFVVAFVLIL